MGADTLTAGWVVLVTVVLGAVTYLYFKRSKYAPLKSKYTALVDENFSYCISCDEELPAGECLKAKRTCGHHCNHSWSHDQCCGCGQVF